MCNPGQKALPHRRDSPLRYFNISDEEAREVETAAAEVAGTQWISIGAVVTGCPCEDGGKCTDQVWVQTHQDQGAIGFRASKTARNRSMREGNLNYSPINRSAAFPIAVCTKRTWH